MYKPGYIPCRNCKKIRPNFSDYERKDNSEDKPAAHHRSKRSFSREYFVETLVVVDHSMVEYYKNEDVNTYIFTIMNMVRFFLSV